MQAVCTNNDVEGYHRGINCRAGKTQIDLYLLIQLLYEESRLSRLNVCLVSDGKLRRRQKIQESTGHAVHMVEGIIS